MTTPGQYPLSLNSLVTGVNQKNNRDPVVEIDEEIALGAIDGLRSKGLARDVTFTGSRVEKYRHTAGEGLELRPPELALISELLLRGPQTVGELRGRASRMHPFDSLETVQNVLETLASRGEPLVRELPPSPGSRAPRWMQLLCEDLHPVGPTGPVAVQVSRAEAPSQAAASGDRLAALEARVAALEARVSALGGALESIGGPV